VTGPKAATSDYEPMPHGFSGLAAPVADEIRPAADGMSVTAVSNHWVVVGAKAGEPADEGILSEVTWSLQENTLPRVELLTSSKPVRVLPLWLAVPSRYGRLETLETGGHRLDRLISDAGTLDVQVKQSDWPVPISAFATGDSPLGRSDRGPIPLQLILESRDISMSPGAPKKWEFTLSAHR
jgi:hypothetical protein